ncbi:hypothetical protein DUNSADRAFT_13213 [Dunaliella salina]|uniref:Annexin n=1 Tax=Dunaliella salina TaxID=3046 RepID=A0ABQ7G9U2_DUNSA|nr:hypothetical protein DUNSADRAFT_13213 [Dunaliella salina]|eukprot:KAF5831371.1 hypothetical protein DUNSADRAFT_13213 [Dunaliella salina]
MPGRFEPEHEAYLLRKATSSSWSTDHKLLIQVIAENERTNDQMQELRRAFLKKFKKCPIETVQGATNLPHQLKYSWALVATLLTREEFAALSLYRAVPSLARDERGMIQILAHSTNEELEHIKKTFMRMYSKTLGHEMMDNFRHGDEREFFLALINAHRNHVDVAAAQDEIDQDVEGLYTASQGGWSSSWLVKTSGFVHIITKHDNEYVAALNQAYAHAYGETLQRAMEKKIPHSALTKGISAMVMDRAEYFASELNRAISGVVTDSDTLTRIIATQRHTMPDICHSYMTKYGVSLRWHLEQQHAIKGTQYGKVLLSLLKVAEATGQGVPKWSSTPQDSAQPSVWPPTPQDSAQPSVRPPTPQDSVQPSVRPTPQDSVQPSEQPPTPQDSAQPSKQPPTLVLSESLSESLDSPSCMPSPGTLLPMPLILPQKL